MSGEPAANGRVVAVTRLNASMAAAADAGRITDADLRLGARGYAFAVARPATEGRPSGRRWSP